MDRYKLIRGVHQTYPIDSSLSKITGEKRPYFVVIRGRTRIYAVCPGCDGPIQICGYFKNTEEAGRKPYGRHVPHSVPEIAEYDEADYENCPYSNRFWTAPSRKISNDNSKVKEIKEFILQNYDRIIYVLEKSCDLKFSGKAILGMLEMYIDNEVWTYRNTRKHNIPWILGEADVARYLLGQKVKKDTLLYEAISKEKSVLLSECKDPNYVRVSKDGKQFMPIMFHFYHHYFIRSEDGEHVDEYIEFAVIDGEAPNIRTIYHKTIKIDQDYFANICEIKNWKQKQWILDIAKDVII